MVDIVFSGDPAPQAVETPSSNPMGGSASDPTIELIAYT